MVANFSVVTTLSVAAFLAASIAERLHERERELAQANAVLEGRNYVIPDDIKKMAVAVLSHRIIPKVNPRRRTFEQCAEVIRDIVKSVPVPA